MLMVSKTGITDAQELLHRTLKLFLLVPPVLAMRRVRFVRGDGATSLCSFRELASYFQRPTESHRFGVNPFRQSRPTLGRELINTLVHGLPESALEP